MTDIVIRLRTWFKDVNAVSAIDLMDEAAAEIEMLRLTEEEREAVEFFVGFHNEGYGMIDRNADTLRKLLERMK